MCSSGWKVLTVSRNAFLLPLEALRTRGSLRVALDSFLITFAVSGGICASSSAEKSISRSRKSPTCQNIVLADFGAAFVIHPSHEEYPPSFQSSACLTRRHI